MTGKQLTLIVCLLATCWLAMQSVHELGHVLAAWWTGGVVSKVVLRPWTISRTELSVNPRPLLVAWGGPLVGAALPLILWLTAKILRFREAFLLRFFAGFCLIANGVYLGAGAVEGIGDAADLQRHGVRTSVLLAITVLTAPTGLALWHGQGRHFGFAGANGHVETAAIWLVVAALAGTLIIQFAFCSA